MRASQKEKRDVWPGNPRIVTVSIRAGLSKCLRNEALSTRREKKRREEVCATVDPQLSIYSFSRPSFMEDKYYEIHSRSAYIINLPLLVCDVAT